MNIRINISLIALFVLVPSSSILVQEDVSFVLAQMIGDINVNIGGQQGPAGPQGEPGPAGPKGEQGPAGESCKYTSTGYADPGLGHQYPLVLDNGASEVCTTTPPES